MPAHATAPSSHPKVLIVTNDFPPRSGGIETFVGALADRFDPDPGHSRHVGRLADSLFLQLQPHFELGHPERELLAHAAALHDIGHALSEKGHHRLGAYLVQNADLAGFWPKERTLIAQIVRHHRGKAPRDQGGIPQLGDAHREIEPLDE